MALNYIVKKTLNDQSLQFLSSEMHNSSKASCYSLLKNDANFEEYLDNLSVKERTLLCKFRTRSTNHRLIIETGRWNGYMKPRRWISLFVRMLFFFNVERKIYLKNEYCQRPDVHKFSNLMNSHNDYELKKLCQFIKIILSIASCPP